jgi:sortase A
MASMRSRPGSRRSIAARAAAPVVALLVAGCGSRAEVAAPAALPAPVAAPTTAVPVDPPPPTTVLPGEDLTVAALAGPAGPAVVPAGIEGVGRIVVPRLGLDTTMLEGDTLDVLAHGPGHRVGSARPGQIGNVVVAGHRTTHSRPFRDLDALVPGDVLTFETPTGTYRYEFATHDVVSPSAGQITDQPYGYVATLFACHPPGSARTRLVAYFRLVSAPEVGQPDPATVPVVPLPFA